MSALAESNVGPRPPGQSVVHLVQTLWPDIKFEAVVSNPHHHQRATSPPGTYGSPHTHNGLFISAQITDYFRTPSAWAATLWTPSFYSSTIPALRDVMPEVRGMHGIQSVVVEGPAGC